MTIEDLRETLHDAVQAQRPGSANAREEVARRAGRQRLRIAAAVGAPVLAAGVVAALAWPTPSSSIRLATRPNPTLAPATSTPGDQTTTSEPSATTTTSAPPQTSTPTPPTVPPTTSTPLVLRPSDSLFPAAGICGATTEGVGYVTFQGGDNVPSPRCLVVRREERFGVTNTSGFTITAAVGTSYRWTLAPGERHLFSVSVGNLLARGVHRLVLTQDGVEVSSADLWIDPVCTGPGPTGCSTPQ